MEAFSTELSTVITRFLKLKEWPPIRRIVVGGCLRSSQIGELVSGRSSVRLKGAGHDIELVAIQHHPDQAALVGAFFFSSRRRHTRCNCDWSSDVCSSDLCPVTVMPVSSTTVSSPPPSGTVTCWLR